MRRIKREIIENGITIMYKTPRKIYITVNFTKKIHKSNNKLLEIFISIGKMGGEINELCEALGRIISVGLRYKIPEQEFIKQLKLFERIGSRGHCYDNGEEIFSYYDAIARAMELAIEYKTNIDKGEQNVSNEL
ncbi:MAG: hypothetical protein H8D45_31390 [Bacteroidetes bacterium]|nr:hypothetical protein [Bacteroidota bacterium]